MADTTQDATADAAATTDPPETTGAAGTTGTDKVDHSDRKTWESEARKHEREAKKARKEIDELRAQLSSHEEAAKSETERAIEAARKDAAEAARQETVASYRQRILTAEIRAAAAGKFANPALAPKLVDVDLDEAFSDDEVNTTLIGELIDEFLEKDENAGLRAGAQSTTRLFGSADAGEGAGPGLSGTPEQQHNQLLAGLLRRS